MKIKHVIIYIFMGLLICAASVAAIYGPARVLHHYDHAALDVVLLEEKDAAVEGYQYALSVDEKLHVLSNALNNRILPQSEYFAAMRSHDGLSDTRTQSYAFQPVYYETEFNDETRSAAFASLLRELSLLTEAGILPSPGFAPNPNAYDVALFTAIDVLEPRKSVTVWEFGFNGANIRNGLVDCIMDAQTNKIYSVSIRAIDSLDYYHPDEVIRIWAGYVGSSDPEPHPPGSSINEDATYYSRYAIHGMAGEQVIVTVGYYEGIEELFIKIDR